ncbi:MAG: biotin-dependent carboxyltransferase family protein [Actinomycetota bacterium]|nr:biotin-dependent carboxyltransferase family protein [Actinomycetota bacterium]
MNRRSLTVLATGPLCTVQDRGRPGYAALGVSQSGAADLGAHDLANRLVGNPVEAATLEITLGGLRIRAGSDLQVAVAGARCPGVPHHALVRLPVGAELTLGAPEAGLRSYLGVRGGVDVPTVLGSRSTDLLSGIGPAPLSDGDVVPVGRPTGVLPDVDLAPVAEPAGGTTDLGLIPGPRRDWFDDVAWGRLTGRPWSVDSQSNRIAVRLEGTPVLSRTREGELSSEGLLRGAVQVPPSGQPVIFGADHPVTGGYPVIGYVVLADQDRCAQLRAGQRIRFHPRTATTRGRG